MFQINYRRLGSTTLASTLYWIENATRVLRCGCKSLITWATTERKVSILPIWSYLFYIPYSIGNSRQIKLKNISKNIRFLPVTVRCPSTASIPYESNESCIRFGQEPVICIFMHSKQPQNTFDRRCYEFYNDNFFCRFLCCLKQKY